jgi:hypothetical protein
LKKILYILIFVGIAIGSFSQTIQLRKPTNGDVWPAFSKQRIEWTSSNIDNIRIESSLDSGRTWTIVVSSYPAPAQFYEWEVANKISDSCFFRIADVTDLTKSSSNFPANPFKIPKPAITIDPLGNTAIQGTILPITWIASGIRQVNIFASFNNKQSFRKIADTIVANNAYYNWLIPDSISSQCFISIQDAITGLYSDTSKIAFTISALPNINTTKFKGGFFDGHSSANNQPLTLNLLSLNNGDSLYGSSNQTISWRSQNVERINIFYSPNNGTTWQLIAEKIPAYAGNFAWKANSNPTNLGRIKIVNALDTFPSSISAKPFIIRKKELKFNQPDSTTIAYKNTVLPISWTSGGVNNIKIKILYNNKDSSIIDSIPAQNEAFNWIINQAIPDTIKMVLQDLSDPSVADTTKQIVLKQLVVGNNVKYKGGAFDGHASKTNARGVLQLLSPNGNEQVSVLNNFVIKWRSNNIDRIKIEYSLDSGKNWTLISGDFSATSNNYNWKTPKTPTQKGLIKISDASDNSLNDISDLTFTLLPKKISNTTDSTNWTRGTAKSIEWLALGIDSIRVSLKTRIDQTWKILVDSLPAKHELYNWVLPSDLADSIWIKIEDISDSSVHEIKSYFKKTNSLAEHTASKFKGGKFDGHTQRSNINKIIINRPLANEVLVGGSKYSITWSSVNLEDSVWIQYSIDSGKTWASITRTIATSGTYEWTVPNFFPTSSSSDIGIGIISSNSINSLNFNRVVPETDLSQKILSEVVMNQNSTNSDINSSNCLIRVLDILSGNLLVGKTSNTFTIVGSRSKLKDSINFSTLTDVELTQANLPLNASAKSNRPINYLIAKGSNKATISANQLIVSKPGKIIIGAFVNNDPSYLPTDTIYQTICVNPSKPSISFNGKLALCANDTIIVSGPSSFSQYLWSNSDTSKNIKVSAALSVSLKVGEEGCFSISSDTIEFTQTNINAIITSSAQSSLCKGDSVMLKSNASTGNQWFKDGNAINGATGSSFIATTAGAYALKTTNTNGCSSALSSAVNLVVNESPAPPTILAGGNDTSVSAGWRRLPLSFCAGGTVTLSSTASTGNQWFKDGNAINGATGSSFIATTAGAYALKTTNTNGCSSALSSAVNLVVNESPAPPTILAGGNDTSVSAGWRRLPLSFCAGGTVTLSSTASNGNQWFKDGNAINGATGPSFIATTAGAYALKTTNANGCSSALSTPLTVVVNANLVKPMITQNGRVLTSSSSVGNQWYENNTILTGETSNTFTPNKNGYFKTQVKNGGCLSPMSDLFYYFMSAGSNNNYQLMPNPVKDFLTIQASSNTNLTTVKLIDVNGRVLLSNSFTKSITIDLKAFKTGMYTLVLTDLSTKSETSKQIIKIN